MLKNIIKQILTEHIQNIKGGGKITFSIEGVVGTNYLQSKINLYSNKLFLKKKLTSIIKNMEIPGFTLTGPNKGLYKSKNNIINTDISYTIECFGIDSETLINLSDNILKIFPAESVLVSDYNTNETFFYGN